MTPQFLPDHADQSPAYEEGHAERTACSKNWCANRHGMSRWNSKMAEAESAILTIRVAALQRSPKRRRRPETAFPTATL